MTYFYPSEPVPIPNSGIQDSPGSCVFIADAWRLVIAGLLDAALDDQYWLGDDDERQSAQTEISKFLAALIGESEQCMPTQENIPDPFVFADQLIANSVLSDVAITLNASQRYGFICRTNPSANGDTFRFRTVPPSATCGLYVLGFKGTDQGKTDVWVDGVKIDDTLYDWYANPSVYNHEVGWMLSDLIPGKATNIDLIVNGKHASSTGYVLRLTRIWLAHS